MGALTTGGVGAGVAGATVVLVVGGTVVGLEVLGVLSIAEAPTKTRADTESPLATVTTALATEEWYRLPG